MKIHAGPGLLGGGKKDPEPKFILDGDFSLQAAPPPTRCPSFWVTCTSTPCAFFHGAITPGAP